MPLVNPVPGFNFNVFLFDAKPLSASAAAIAASLGGVAGAVASAVVFGAFSEVSGLNAELETEEYREGGLNRGPRVFAKWGKYPPLTLRRGVTFNPDLWDWYYQVLYGTRAPLRKNGVIVLNDRGGVLEGGTGLPLNVPVLDRTPVAVWYFSNGLPSKLVGPGLDAKANQIAIETLEISHEWLVRLGPGMIPGVGDALAAVGL